MVGDLHVTDHIMENSFWIGVYPGMTDAKLDYMAKVLCEAVWGQKYETTNHSHRLRRLHA